MTTQPSLQSETAAKAATTRSPIVWPAIGMTLFFVVFTGLVFPFAVYGLSQVLFPNQANGSLIKDAKGQVVGSAVLGQDFARPEYFHPRPSAAGSGYDAANSSGTNLGPTSDKLINGIADDPKTKDVDESFAGVKQLAEAYRAENGLPADTKLPSDAVTRSASGLDPHISVENALLQAARVARERNLSVAKVRALITASTDPRFAGVFGEPAVHVLRLNMALDRGGP
ncbi:MAG: K(+)-transporting ATPase subunit C [Armatimonadetes bacterium]|nr:K(+)-transporting ATPase subunit C [Armatimonadota bacterium]